MEYSGKIVFWGLPDDEFMTHEILVPNPLTVIDRLINDYLDTNFGKEIPGEIIIYGYTKVCEKKIKISDYIKEETC